MAHARQFDILCQRQCGLHLSSLLDRDECIGATVLPTSAGLSRRQITLMVDLGATVLAVAESAEGLTADYVVELRSGLDPALSRVLVLPALQLLAYYRSLHNGLDPDHPTHLDAVVML